MEDAIGIAHMQRHAEVDERAAAAAEAVVGWRTHQEIAGRAILDRRIAARGPADDIVRARLQNRAPTYDPAMQQLQRCAHAAGLGVDRLKEGAAARSRGGVDGDDWG